MILFTAGIFPFSLQQMLQVGASGGNRNPVMASAANLNDEAASLVRAAYEPEKSETTKRSEGEASLLKQYAPALPGFTADASGKTVVLSLESWPRGFSECTIRSMNNEKITQATFFASHESARIEIPLPEKTARGMYWVETEIGHNLLRKKVLVQD